MTTFSSKLNADATQRYIRDALPKTVARYLTPQRMSKLALSVFSRTPALWNCTVESVIRSIVDCASLGLEPTGGAMAQAYLVPYGKECQLIVAYQGLIELARRSGEFVTLDANAVYERDTLNLRYGFDAFFEHQPYMGADDRGELIGAYCVAKFKNGERSVCFMRKEDIEKRRMTSQVGRNNRGPWAEWPEEMAVKTVIKKAAKMWPKTSELADAMSRAIDVDADGQKERIIPMEALAVEPPPDRSEQLADKISAQEDGEVTAEQAADAADAAEDDYAAELRRLDREGQ